MAWPTRDDILAELKRSSAWDKNPVLPEADLDTIIDKNARAKVWSASTTFSYNDKIVPSARNGFHYRCILTGTTAASEPVWPDNSWELVPFLRNLPGDQGIHLVDGTAMWSLGGTDWDNLWDMNTILHQAWMQKAALATQYMNVGAGRSTFDLKDIYDNCVAMAKRYKTTRFA
jgi:hypothetical protein